ncbi:MAG TPA: hypothetical protein VFU34_10300, partial [Gaiellaceae bacterium]|nr:hypothetical protein [Gaiellaceae bacterium]
MSGSREKTDTERPVSDATYTFAPSGLSVTPVAPSSAVPSTQAPPLPVSLTQPAGSMEATVSRTGVAVGRIPAEEAP